MRIVFLIFCCIIPVLLQAQTPVFRPKPVTIDLANPKAGTKGMTRAEKKDWKRMIKEKKKDLKLKDRMYEHMLDSAQLANYKKYHVNDSLSKNRSVGDVMKSMTQAEIDRYQTSIKSQYGIPDSVDLTRANDSTYLQSLSPETQQQLAAYGLPSDSLSMFSRDSLGGFQSNPNTGAFSEEAIEGFAQNQLAGSSSELGSMQQEQMMFSSYEEMIASDRYQELMQDMPGMKKDIESGFQNGSIDEKDLPVAESVFKGNEDKLAMAMETNSLARKKRPFREYLKQLVNQDMGSVKEKSVVQRFSLTGYIQLSNYDPLFIDYSPNISYAFTGKARLGVGVTGRAKIGEGDDDENEKLFAYRGFLEYDILKNIYLHGEYERTGIMVTDPQTDIESRVWDGHWLLGLGTDVDLPGFLKGSILILYNFDNDLANSPNPRRFHIRYGVKF